MIAPFSIFCEGGLYVLNIYLPKVVIASPQGEAIPKLQEIASAEEYRLAMTLGNITFVLSSCYVRLIHIPTFLQDESV